MLPENKCDLTLKSIQNQVLAKAFLWKTIVCSGGEQMFDYWNSGFQNSFFKI